MKFSIIVPVYGVEAYLDECVNSLLAQTYQSFEVILVDDCSPDSCPQMCDEYARRDDRVRVIHKPQNEGLGFARNTGMAQARGEYILFVDSDDYISHDTLEECAAHLEEGVDLITFGVTCVYQDKQGKTTWTEELNPQAMTARCPKDNAQAFISLNQARIFPFVCNKIYRRAFLESCGVLFEKTKLIEDFLFNIRVFTEARHIVLIERAFYFYRKPAHETLVSRYAPEFFDLFQRKYAQEKAFLQACQADCFENNQVIYASYIKHFISAIMRNRSVKAKLSRKQQMQRIRQMLQDPVTREVVENYVPQGMKMKLIAFAMEHNMAHTCKLIGIGADFAQGHMKQFFKKYLIGR